MGYRSTGAFIMNIYIRYIKNRHKPILARNTVEYCTFLYLKTANIAGFADLKSDVFLVCNWTFEEKN